MKIERTKNATRNIIFGVILKLYQIVIPFVIRTAMIYLMGVQYLGLNSLFTSVLQVLNLAELGVGSAMVFSMYKPIAEDDSVTICALMKLYKTYYRFIGLVVAVVGGILTPFIPKLISGDVPSDINVYVLYLLNLSATVLSYWLFAYKNSILQAHQRNDIISRVMLITNTIQYAVQILVLWLFKNYYLFVIVLLLSQVMTNLVTAYFANKLYPQYKAEGKISENSVKDVNQRIKDLVTAKIGSTIFNSVDTIVISAFLGLTVLAIYQNYYYIITAATGVLGVFFTSITAGMGNSFVTETKEKNYELFMKLTFLVNWIICICCCCLVALYQPFMNIWVGKKLMLDNNYVFLFVLYLYGTQIRQLWCTVKDAAGIWHEDRFRPLCSSSVNLILNIVLVKIIGLPGILISSIVSCMFVGWPWLIHNIFTKIYDCKATNYLKFMFGLGFTTLFSVAATYFACLKIELSGFLGLIVFGVIALVISNVCWIVCWSKNEHFSASVFYIKKILHLQK